MDFRLFIVLTLISCSVLAQEITLQLRDSLSGEAIPFATVMTNFGENNHQEWAHFQRHFL